MAYQQFITAISHILMGAIIVLGIKTFEKKIPPITTLRIYFKNWVIPVIKFDSLFRVQYQMLIIADLSMLQYL